MSVPETQMKANLYRGRLQPDPDQRLAQIRTFLADEDYHRSLRFARKLAEIEEYIAFIEKNSHEVDKELLKRIKEMIGVHKNWIKRATRGPSTSYIFTQYVHKNRLLGLIKDVKRRKQIARVKAPKLSQDLIPGPALHKCMEKEDRPASPDPFLHTKQLAEIRRRQDTEAEQIRDKEQSAVLKEPIPTNFNGPYTPFYKLTLPDITERRNILSETLKRLNEAAALAPRPFIYEVISLITHSIQDGRAKALGQVELSLTNEDIQQLLILAEPSWNAEVRRAMRDLSEDGSPQSTMFAQLIELFNSDLWPDHNSEATLADIFSRFRSDVEGEPMTVADVETFLVEMNEIGSIKYDITTRIVRKPFLDQHPEDGFPQELYRITAKRFGYAVAHLESILEDDEGNGDTALPRDTSSISSIKQRVEAKFPLPIVAPTPPQPQESKLIREQAARLLQRQIILEHHHNWDDREPNFQKLWAFASSIENPKQFFALDRWPPELQLRERRNEILQSGPAPPSPEHITEEDFPRPKENETFYPGEAFFPFGETPYHEALLSRQIDLNQPDVPKHQAPYSDPFALPELPESETPALMDYAARLGLGKRKRPIEDNPFVLITDPNVLSVPIIATEQIAAPSCPTPEFSLETIGGVEMRVAEGPAGRGRRHVRFTAPGIAGGSSNSSKGLGRGIVRPAAEPGWFGPKLGAKHSGNGDGSGECGQTGGGSAGGQGWVKRPKAASSSVTASSEGL